MVIEEAFGIVVIVDAVTRFLNDRATANRLMLRQVLAPVEQEVYLPG